jgi:hyaluronate lyase
MALADPLSPSLTARKSWFMFDREVVCLGADITCSDDAEVDTTVENRRLGTAPSNRLTVDGTAYAPVMGWKRSLGRVSWCALDGVGGYVFPGGASNLRAAFTSNTGGWSDVTGDKRGPAPPFTDDYLKLWYDHGARPAGAAYAYVLLPNLAAGEVAAYAARPEIVVLVNSSAMQAAAKPSLGVVMANFWTGRTQSAGGITAEAPASVVTCAGASGLAVGICDPTQANPGSIRITLDQAATAVVSADPGIRVEQLAPKIVLRVDVAGSLGKSFQAVFKGLPPPGR